MKEEKKCDWGGGGGGAGAYERGKRKKMRKNVGET